VTQSTRSTRLTTIELGARNEAGAAAALEAAGYRVVERNFRCKAGELDIIARDGDILVFVEVRSRSDGAYGDAAFAVGPGKRQQVARIARAYLALRDPDFDQSRFDVVAITGDRVEIFKDAFRT
jgi:putative endonuclease